MEPQDQLSSQESAESAAPSAGDSHGRALQISIVGVVLVLLFAVLVGFFTDFNLFKVSQDQSLSDQNLEEGDTEDSGKQARLEISQDEVKMYTGGETVPLTLTYNGKDVTQDAFWYSEDPKVVHVASAEPIKGEVNARGTGVTTVRAFYEEEYVETKFVVMQPGLQTDCSLIPEEAKVGEEVRLVAMYTEIGVPFYEYRWSGDGGLKDTGAVAYITYDSPGLKKIHYETADTEGSITKMDCEIRVVE